MYQWSCANQHLMFPKQCGTFWRTDEGLVLYPLGAYDQWLKLFPLVWLLTVSLTFAKFI